MPGTAHLRLVYDAGHPAPRPRQTSVRHVLDTVSPEETTERISWAVVSILRPGAESYPIDRLGAIWGYVKLLGYWGVMDAASIAEAHTDDFDQRYNYFRGVCRRKLRQISGDQ